MKIRVVYYSLTGNTKKLAEAIAVALNVKAEAIGKTPIDLSAPVDLLFIGGAINAGRPNGKVAAFIKQLHPDMVKNAAVFATYGGVSRIGNDLRKLVEDQGVKVIAEPFICKGQSWLFFNRHRPNAADLQRIAAYAQQAAAANGRF